MTIGLRFDKGPSPGTANQSREDFAIGDVCTIVATGVVGVATFQILAQPPGSTAVLVPVDAVSQNITIDVAERWDIRVGDTADGSRVEHTFAAPTLLKGLIAPAHSERASADANAADTDPGTWVDESHSNLAGRFTGYAPDLQKVVAAVDVSAEINTGWLDGGDATINAPAQFDVAAGVVWVRGQTRPVRFGPFPAEDPLNLATEEFTVLAINAAAELVKFNRALTDEEHVTHAELQTVLHVDNATVTGIDETRFLAEHLAKACADYVIENGPLNRGNNYTAAATDLTVKKSLGTTIKLFLRGAASVTAPNPQPNAASDPVTFLRTIRDGAGDFIFFPTTIVPVGFWDNNSGLLATPKFVNHQFRFFNGITGLVVGQTTYDTLDEAIAAIFTEDPAIPDAVTAQRNNLRTVLSVKGDVTDLSDTTNLRFTQVSPGFPGGILEVGMM